MDRSKRLASIIAIASLAVAAAVPVTAETVSGDDSISGDDCCFTNPRYTGVCRVTPGPDETCADILAYLNNQSSVGKTYCGNTKVRGGWAQVECETSTSSGLCGPLATSTTDPRP